MKAFRILFLILVVITAAGCSQDRMSDADTGGLVDARLPGLVDKATVVEGVIGNGAMYALHCPDNWNGDLVVYTHGYAFPETDPTLPDAGDAGFVDLRDALLGMGYGVAFSAYSETGWAVDVAMSNSRQLRGLFTSEFGVPDRTFLMGNSMGGLIALALAERNPGLYAGALPMCGVLGGTDMAIAHVYGVRVLFDYFYPGVLPGSANDVPADLHWSTAAGLAQAAILANPLPAFEMGGVSPTNLQFTNPQELVAAIVWPIIFHTASFTDFVARNHGHDFFDNTDVVYSGSADDAALNAGIGRYAGTPAAAAYAKRWYEPTGKLRIPVVTLHTTRDQVVQIFNEHDFLAKVTAAGTSDLLRQYEVDRFGHCTFALEEMLAAFAELVAWADELEAAGGGTLATP